MDRLEDDLRRVLTDPRRTPPPDLVTLDGVHRGATRRRRVRAVGASALAVLVVAGGVALAARSPFGGNNSLPATHSPTPTVHVSQGPQPVTPTPSVSATASGNALPAGFQPRSFTAIGTRTFIVLGTDAACGTPPCPAYLAETADAGKTWHALTPPAAQWTNPGQGSGRTTVSDVRFGSALDGWGYGDALWSTHDGGRTWHRVPMPGQVVDVEAGAGVAWAIVEGSSGIRSLMKSDVTIDGWTDAGPSWATPRTLAVDGSHVLVWASATSAKVPHGGKPSLLSTTDAGKSWTLTPTPTCYAELGGSVYASGGGVWLVCPTGMMAAVYPHPLTGWTALDTSRVASGSLPNSVLAAPRDAASAALGLDAVGIVVVTDSGQVLHRADVGGAPWFIGFTTLQVGYALVARSGGGNALLRTADGGATWRTVSIG